MSAGPLVSPGLLYSRYYLYTYLATVLSVISIVTTPLNPTVVMLAAVTVCVCIRHV